MSTQQLSREDARAIARIIFGAQRRRLARLAAEQEDGQQPREDTGGGVDA